MSVAKEMDTITQLLKDDSAYYYGWQANIAMAFQDECSRQGIESDKVYNVANQAAKNFLNLLISQSTKN